MIDVYNDLSPQFCGNKFFVSLWIYKNWLNHGLYSQAEIFYEKQQLELTYISNGYFITHNIL